VPVDVIGSNDPLPTTMEVGLGYRGKVKCERVSGHEVMWEVAPELMYQSAGCYRVMVLNVDASDC
jgi:hypothetical protein